MALIVLGFVVFLASNTVDTKFLKAGYYEGVLDHSHAYDRAYNDVATDPALSKQTSELLGGTQVPVNEIAGALGAVVGPEALRAAVEVTIEQLIAFLKSDRPLELAIDVTDFVLAAGAGNAALTAAQIATLPTEKSASYDVFKANLQQTMDQLAKGTAPKNIPTFDIPKANRGEVSGIIKKGAGVSDDNLLDAPITFAVDQAIDGNDVVAAIEATMVKGALGGITNPGGELAHEQFIHQQGTGPTAKYFLGPPADVTKDVSDTLWIVRLSAHAAVWGRPVGAALVALGALALLVFTWPARRKAFRRVAIPLIFSGVLGLAAWQIGGRILRRELVSVAVGDGSTLPATYAGLVKDVLSQALTDAAPAFWLPSVVVLGVGLLFGALSLLGSGEEKKELPPPTMEPLPEAVAAPATLRWRE